MAQLRINYTATSDIQNYSYSGRTWVQENVDHNLSSWDSTTQEGILVFNEGVDNIGPYAFNSCSALLTLKFNTGWTRIGTSLSSWNCEFQRCNNLTSVEFSDTMTFLGASAFSSCGKIANISFGNSMADIGYYCFDNNSTITNVTFPATLTSIGQAAFTNCPNLKTVVCKATTPPTLGASNFTAASGDTLYVPSSAVSTYRNNSSWSVFTNIEGMYTVTATASTGGSISPSGSVVVLGGETITFNMTPDTGYEIEQVVYDGIDIGTIDNYTIQNINADHTISVTFKRITHNIEAYTRNGGNIIPVGNVVVNEGDSQTFTITPEAHYYISDVTVDGVSVGAVSTYTFTNVTENHIIWAYFAPITHTITVTSNNGGEVEPNGTVTVYDGESQTFNITPNDGYIILSLEVDGTGIEPSESYTFENVTTDHTLDVEFYKLRRSGFNRDQMLDIDYLVQTYIKKKRN